MQPKVNVMVARHLIDRKELANSAPQHRRRGMMWEIGAMPQWNCSNLPGCQAAPSGSGIRTGIAHRAQVANARLDRADIIIQLAKENAEVEVAAITDRGSKLLAMRSKIEQSVKLIGLNIGGDHLLDSTVHFGSNSLL